MSVMTFVLVTGQEIVADVDHVGDDFVHARDPLVFQQGRDPETGRIVNGFAEWPALAERSQTIRVPISGILSMPAEAHEEIKRNYIANTTGLALPSANPKILLG
jgi:hypothetical protein